MTFRLSVIFIGCCVGCCVGWFSILVLIAQSSKFRAILSAVIYIRVIVPEMDALGALQIRGGNALGEGTDHYNSVAPYTVMQPAMLRIFNLI